MTRIIIQNYILTIIAYLMLMISIVTINLLHQPLLKMVSYISLPLSFIITIYGILEINKSKKHARIEVWLYINLTK